MLNSLKGNTSEAALQQKRTLVQQIEGLKHKITLTKSPGEQIAVLESALIKKTTELEDTKRTMEELAEKQQQLESSIHAVRAQLQQAKQRVLPDTGSPTISGGVFTLLEALALSSTQSQPL
eukprot:11800630-Karenia_brevis.AAC.1